MLFKRGSTISAAEGGCQAEVGGTPWSPLRVRIPDELGPDVQWRVLWPAQDLQRVWEVNSLLNTSIRRLMWLNPGLQHRRKQSCKRPRSV